jgi:phage terminase small subunit
VRLDFFRQETFSQRYYLRRIGRKPINDQQLECPSEFGPVAQNGTQSSGELTSKGESSGSDPNPLAAYCMAYALVMEATEMIHKRGAMLKSPNGFSMQSPYLVIGRRGSG